MKSLTFQSTKLDIVDRKGQRWLRAGQIAHALGYRDATSAARDLYRRHASEFPDDMTQVIKLKTKGGTQDVRVYSLRGVHLFAMLARTPKAQEFRRWVLDVLEKELAPPVAPPAPTLPPPPPTIGKDLQAHINRTAHRLALKQYDTIHAILTNTAVSNLACGATEANCFGYVEAIAEGSDGTVLVNLRDLQEVIWQASRVIDAAGTAVAAMRRIEQRSGLALVQRHEPLPGVDPEFHQLDRLVQELIDRMV